MKLKKIAHILAIMALSISSCKKSFLAEPPDNRTKINTLEKLAQLSGTAYPSYDYLTFAETASDNAEDKGTGDITAITTSYYNWADDAGTGTNTTSNYWNGCYEAIAAANHVLEAIETEGFGAEANPYKGEALVARAYAYHMLAIFFAKNYNKSGDNSSFGIPYTTKPETKLLAQYSRGTVQLTYDNIEKDLEAGIPLLDDSKYSIPKYHFTKSAAHAFAARFYLFKGDWQKAVDHANAAVPNGDYTGYLRPMAGKFKEIGFDQFNLDFSKTDVKATFLLSTCYSTYQRIYTTPRYGYGAKLTAMFESKSNPIKKAHFSWVLSYGQPHFTTYKWKEFSFYVTQSTVNPYLPVILLTADETILNRAEAHAQLGHYEEALKDINQFYSTRISFYNPANDLLTLERIKNYFLIDDPKAGIIQTILTAKKAEFLQEGIRWLDIVRHGLTVKKNFIKPVTEEEIFIELKPDDLRRVFQLPESAKLAGVEPNPR